MGLSSALSLARRGHIVTVLDQHEVGNEWGSSTGASRIVRQAYPDEFYTRLLLDAYPMWERLDEQAGGGILYETGLLTLGPSGGREQQDEIAALEATGIAHEVLSPADVHRRFPAFRLSEEESGIFTPRAGWVSAPRVLAAIGQLAMDLGVQIVRAKVEDLTELADFDQIILACGPFIHHFAPLPVDITRQTICYMDQRIDGPVWIENFGDHLYGFPSEPGRNDFKIGFHNPGDVMDPHAEDRVANSRQLKAMLDLSRRRFGVESPRITEKYACLYTFRDNDDFLIGWLDDRTLVVSPCSGHGFKFGPWIGELVAKLAEGEDRVENWPRFLWSKSN